MLTQAGNAQVAVYDSYFGFREKPFKLVPNPEYLFLSKTHEIALAHLSYATDQGEGFVVIIGEVGTGKTTLCRNYLEGLDENYDSAYIFNPRLNSNELLASICQEYGIPTTEQNTKALLDTLNRFLIIQNTAGRKVVLLIDEAQLLSIENLELVRMLSNLETTKNKLLQIILVGQPELAEKLETYELRQLAQRISLNYHLTPLSFKDTEAYIRHRIGIASQRQDQIFSADACRLAYRYSKGIPRLINIVCDRALLTAYSRNKSKVTKTIMQDAILELTATSQTAASSKRRFVILGSCIGAMIVLILGAFFLYNKIVSDQSSVVDPSLRQTERAINDDKTRIYKFPVDYRDMKPATHGSKAARSGKSGSPAVTENNTTKTIDTEHQVSTQGGGIAPTVNAGVEETRLSQADFEKVLESLEPHKSRRNCAALLLSAWQQPRPNVDLIPDEIDDSSFFEIAARQYGLRNYVVSGNWELVKTIDLPAVLTLRHPENDKIVFLSLIGRSGNHLKLARNNSGETIEIDLESLKPYTAGPVHIYWKNLIGFDMIIGYGADKRAVMMVKTLLRKIGYSNIPSTPQFDAQTKKAIKNFQAGHNLGADGLVGPLTKIMLLREAGTLSMPKLNIESRTGL